MLQLRSRKMLDHADHGWLTACHHFVVSPRGNPAHTPLGSLVVWNDDEIAPAPAWRHTALGQPQIS
jgi:quercetin 2,3-dioxygenase